MPYPASYNLVGSGIARAFRASERPYNIAFLGDHNFVCDAGVHDALYALTANKSGWFCNGGFDLDFTSAWTGASDVTTNVTVGEVLWPFNRYWHNGLGAAPTSSEEGQAYLWDHDSEDGLGVAGDVAYFMPAAFQELVWPQSASAPGADQRLVVYTLASVAGSDAWCTDRPVTITPMVAVPDADAGGTFPMLGGPALSLGVWRGSDSPSVAASIAASAANALIAGTPGELAAGAELPRWALYWPTSAANSKRRCAVAGAWVVNDQSSGVRLGCFGVPYASMGDWDHAGSVEHLDWPGLYAIGQEVGGWDAAVLWLSSEMDAGFLNLSLLGDMLGELQTYTGDAAYGFDVGIWSEVTIDVANGVKAELGDDDNTRPTLVVLDAFAGLGDSLADWDFIYGNMLQQTWFMCTNAALPTNQHKWTGDRIGYIDLNREWTPTDVMTGGLIAKGGTTVRGLWDAGTTYSAGDIVVWPGASFLGGPGSHNWFVSPSGANLGNQPPDAPWEKLDFTPTEAFALAKVQAVRAKIDAAIRQSRGSAGAFSLVLD